MMRMICPKLDAPTITIAEEQEEYKPVTAALVKHPDFDAVPSWGHNTVVLCFRPTDDERSRLASGEDVYVSLLTFGGPMQPIIVTTGAAETAEIYGVTVA